MTDVWTDDFPEDESLRGHEKLSDNQPKRNRNAIPPSDGFA